MWYVGSVTVSSYCDKKVIACLLLLLKLFILKSAETVSVTVSVMNKIYKLL